MVMHMLFLFMLSWFSSLISWLVRSLMHFLTLNSGCVCNRISLLINGCRRNNMSLFMMSLPITMIFFLTMMYVAWDTHNDYEETKKSKHSQKDSDNRIVLQHQLSPFFIFISPSFAWNWWRSVLLIISLVKIELKSIFFWYWVDSL